VPKTVPVLLRPECFMKRPLRPAALLI